MQNLLTSFDTDDTNDIKQSWISQERRELQKFYQTGYIVILNYLCNAIKKTLGEILLHRHFK
jgi:hypothetical protein